MNIQMAVEIWEVPFFDPLCLTGYVVNLRRGFDAGRMTAAGLALRDKRLSQKNMSKYLIF